MPVITAAIAFALAVFLSTFVAARIRPNPADEASAPIPRQRPLILGAASAVITAALTVADSPLWWVAAAVTVLTPVFVVTGVIDAQTRRLPNVYTLISVAAAAAATVAAAFSGHSGLILPAVAAAAVVFFAFLAMNLFSGGFGMGDVKIGGVQAYLLVILGGVTWTSSGIPLADNLVTTLYITAWAFLAFFAGTAWILVRRALGHTGIPFGPFLVAAFFAALPAAPLLHQVLIPGA